MAIATAVAHRVVVAAPAALLARQELGLEISGRVRTGTYGINMYMLDISSPFGGFKKSGIGREFDEEGLAEYTELQTVVSAGSLPAMDGRK